MRELEASFTPQQLVAYMTYTITDPLESASMTLFGREDAIADLVILNTVTLLGVEELDRPDLARYEQLAADDAIRLTADGFTAGSNWQHWFGEGLTRIGRPGSTYLEVVDGIGVYATQPFLDQAIQIRDAMIDNEP